MTYLDDPDHVWDLDPATVSKWDLDAGIMLEEFIGATRDMRPEDIKLILDGARGLLDRFRSKGDVVSVEQCLDTSMIWYFG